MDIRRNADRLTLIYTATLSRFGSGPCIRRPTAVQARSHLNTQLANADTIRFFFFSPRKRGFVRTLRTPLGYVPGGTVSKLKNTNRPHGSGEEQDSKLGNSLTLAFLVSKRVIRHDLIQLEVVRMTMYEKNSMDFSITTLG